MPDQPVCTAKNSGRGWATSSEQCLLDNTSGESSSSSREGIHDDQTLDAVDS